MDDVIIPKPCKDEVEKYLKNWNDNNEYVEQDKALFRLFQEEYPQNNNVYDILTKVSTLNSIYSTNIYRLYLVANNIYSLKIDERLKNNDESLVNDIAAVEVDGKIINYYSFATKYCNFHYPEEYPIFDSYVEKILKYFKDKDKFANFTAKELRNYHDFKKVLKDFRRFYDIDSYSVKEIDQYLWQLGKEFFNKKV